MRAMMMMMSLDLGESYEDVDAHRKRSKERARERAVLRSVRDDARRVHRATARTRVVIDRREVAPTRNDETRERPTRTRNVTVQRRAIEDATDDAASERARTNEEKFPRLVLALTPCLARER